MNAAIENICSLGLKILKVHQSASEKALEQSRHWKLEERQKEERAALQQSFNVGEIVLGQLDVAMQRMEPEFLSAAAVAIDQNLPRFEEAFVTMRHAALDLLRWTQRAGRIEGSALPDEYRASYAQLISFAPEFKPRLEALQQELLELAHDPEADKSVQALLSAITRYNGALDAARRFIQAIVEPPLELVFQETNLFIEDWKSYPIEERGRLASDLNDCCQFLLYDEAEFNKRAEAVNPQLPEGLEASLFVLPVDTVRILFTVDEDPVFGQLTVTLLRAVRSDCHDEACESIIQTLYSELTGGASHG
ncbi:MAG: hypothetical protein ABFR47_03540 [Verrucomicrobiota bacterium]